VVKAINKRCSKDLQAAADGYCKFWVKSSLWNYGRAFPFDQYISPVDKLEKIFFRIILVIFGMHPVEQFSIW